MTAYPPARRLVRFLFASLLLSWTAALAQPIRLHPDNGHYFLFREKPVVLIGSSEHYGAIINLDFDYIRYLDETRACGLNLVRVFSGTYRENPGAFNIEENTLSPLTGRSVAPWKRTETAGAADGGNRFDLTQWDGAYFHRLRDFTREAGKRGIIVELTFFSSIYDDGLWALSPMNTANHINGVGNSGRAAAYSPTGNLLPFQKALARKCATELRDFDNVIFEISNEPYMGGIPKAWEDEIIDELVATEAGFPHRHLIARNVFNNEGLIENPHPAVSLFNFHYAKPVAASANLSLGKALGDDETGFAGKEDFAYRREAWEFLFSGGALFNHLDFSFTATREDGIASQSAPGGGGPGIRRQLGVLRWFVEEMPLVDLQWQPDLVSGGVPAGTTATAIGKPGSAYGIYLAGGTQTDLVLDLPAGTYRGRWIDPRSGLARSEVAEFVHGGGGRTLSSPTYNEDLVLQLSGGSSPRPRVTLTAPAYNRVVSSNSGGFTLSAEASAITGQVQRVEFFEGEKSLGTVTAAPYNLAVTNPAEGRHLFRAKVVTTDDREGFSPPLKVLVVGPFQSGVNLNGGALMVDGNALQSEADATGDGLTTNNARPVSLGGSLQLYPVPDPTTSDLLGDQLLLSGPVPDAPLGISHPVPDGYYDVFLYVVEGQASHSRDMIVSLEGETVATGVGDLAIGEWHKYGPYRTRVSGGKLDISLEKETKGAPKIAGFTIYQAEEPPSEGWLEIERDKDVLVLTYPAGLPGAVVEASDTLAGPDWEDLPDPEGAFSDRNVIPVAIDRPARFFRLRMD
ncbi:MAG: hypothetical protein EOP88_00855 [Verrucomicrobiaceae bacterium]|nr:MAG: hypothetical protein EOP88_00855 [Verrucomicrobiaceae bacterium]